MNTTIWILQASMALVFLYSGINKAYFDEKTLVEKGQTGVEGLSKWFIKFIGVSEIFGAIGLIAPMYFEGFEFLTAASALCLGSIMIPAAMIHCKRNEYKNAILNVVILLICLTIAYFRLK